MAEGVEESEPDASPDSPGPDPDTAILSTGHPVLPRNTNAVYVNEGAANIVYKLTLLDTSPGPSELPTYGEGTPPPEEINYFSETKDLDLWDGKLLRLRKNLAHTSPYTVAQANFLSYISPHFDRDHLVDQCLVEVRHSNIVQRLNQELEKWDEISRRFDGSCQAPRPAKRQGVYLADDDYGLLVTDMTAYCGVDLLELKPRWLVQSPSAPKYSKRCRTCAKRARVNAELVRSGSKPSAGFCPLDLVSKDDTVLIRAAHIILGIKDPISQKNYNNLYRFCEWVKTSPILQRLQDKQIILDQKGVFAANPHDKNFLTCMTLRDCSIFLHFPDDMTKPIRARIGDLDLKTTQRAGHWKDVELALLQEGWYSGEEKPEDKQPLDCNLFPEYWTPDAQKPKLEPKEWSD